MLKLIVFAVVLGLAGCAQVPKTMGYGECLVPVKRPAGMGVYVEGCAAWSFGPSKKQRADFDAAVARRNW